MPTLAFLRTLAILPWLLPSTPEGLEATVVTPAAEGDVDQLFRYAGFKSTVQEARRLMGQHRFAESRRQLEICLAAIPEHAEAHYLLAQMAYEEHHFDKCLAHLQVAERSLLKRDQLLRAELEAAEARSAALEAALQASLSSLDAEGVDPKGCSGSLYTTRQHALNDHRQQKLGSASGESLPEGIPAEFHLLHGNCLLRLNRLEEARTCYLEAIRKDPKGPVAWNNLIGLYLVRRNLPEARACLDRAQAAGVAVRPELQKALQEKTAP